MKKILNFLKSPFQARAFIRVSLLLLLVIGAIVLKSNYKIFKVDGESMTNTLGSGDVVLVDKQFYDSDPPQRGDVIVCVGDGDVLIKRIVGVPGDTVQIIEGFIIVNGALYEDEFENYQITISLVDEYGDPLRSWVDGEPVYEYANEPEIYLSSIEYWVIGDNRAISWYGIIDEADIIGKVYDL